jgi:hypothetical protein
VEFFGFVVCAEQLFSAVIKLCAENKALKHSWLWINRSGTIEHAQEAEQGAVDGIGHCTGYEGSIGLGEPVEPGAQLDHLWVRGAAWWILQRGDCALDRGGADMVDQEFNKPFPVKQVVFHYDAILPGRRSA